MKARIIDFYEVEASFREVVIELARRPMDKGLILDKAGQLSFLLRLCICQMKATDAAHYPGKDEHLKILKTASGEITYGMNTCTIEEADSQINKAYKAFGVQ